MRGQDIEAKVEVNLDEAASGVVREFVMRVPERLPDGHVQTAERRVKVRIPKGATSGQKLRVPGKGSPGAGGAASGDLYLTVEFAPHPFLRADEHDLYLELPVAPWEAALGAEVEIPDAFREGAPAHSSRFILGSKTAAHRQRSAQAAPWPRGPLLPAQDRDPARPVAARTGALRATQRSVRLQPAP